MKPEIRKISEIAAGQSVICIIGSDDIPTNLALTNSEKEFAAKQIKAKEPYVFINSYSSCTYIVRLKEDLPHFRIREELRRTAYKLRSTIKRNSHTELVITSEKAYSGAVEDFTEGLVLSIYSFRKYITKEDDDSGKKIPRHNSASY